MQFKLAIKILAWLAAVVAVSALAVICATQRQTLEALRAEQRVQQDKLRELDSLRAENEQARHLQNQVQEIERLRENTKDLMRLRSEVTQLRKQLAELETLRSANAQLLQALQNVGPAQPNQLALVTAARKKGAILGVTVRPANAGQTGVVVTGVDASSPVATSGVLPGDLIVALDGRPVRTPGQLMAEMLTRTPGETIVVDLVRTNTVLRFQVQTRAWPQ
jgi:predicted metalloprotease with PDZ domain